MRVGRSTKIYADTAADHWAKRGKPLLLQAIRKKRVGGNSHFRRHALIGNVPAAGRPVGITNSRGQPNTTGRQGSSEAPSTGPRL
ncbi:hypothetical protein SMICM304S_10293 [Streptomyces microflavus]